MTGVFEPLSLVGPVAEFSVADQHSTRMFVAYDVRGRFSLRFGLAAECVC
ncbi:hypothetical protein ACIBEH_05155 [Nocardia salmonicida]